MKTELQIFNDFDKSKRGLSLVIASLIVLFTTAVYAQNPNSNVDGGVISTSDNTTICVDGIPDPIDVSVDGFSGQNQQWIITDDVNNILALPPAPPFDFDGAGPGVCRIWHLSFNGIKPLSKISNLSEIVGKYDLSNYIEVVRQETEAATLSGGPFEFCVGDGLADNIPEGAISVSGGAGSNSAWVVTDDQGNILGLPPSPYVVNFDGAGQGTCLVWYLTFEDGLQGAAAGNNAADLEGCFSLSNPISVLRNQPDAGTISGGPFEFCVGDGIADNIPEGSINVSGGTGTNSAWVVTDDQGNILGLPPSPYVVNFDGAGEGTCLVWYLRYEDGLEGLEAGNNANDLVGCFDLSNPISVIRNQPDAGTIEGGPFEFVVGDGNADNIPEGSINVSGGTGTNSAWVVTDDLGNILGLPPSPYVVNFDVAGEGTCLVWYLRYEDGLIGLEAGNNAADLEGCYSLSNPIEVFRAFTMATIAVYPNPATTKVTIDFNNSHLKNVKVEFRDFQNQLRYKGRFDNKNSSKRLEFDLSSLKPGIYVVSITDLETGSQEIRKIVVN